MILRDIVLIVLFVADKFYMVTQTTIDNLVSQNMDAEFPLVLSQEELGIIKNSRTSTLILGRSGTGKTTCLVYKLLGRYLAANHLKLARPRRQVRNYPRFENCICLDSILTFWYQGVAHSLERAIE